MGKSMGRIELTANEMSNKTVKMSSNILTAVKELIKSKTTVLKITTFLKTHNVKFSLTDNRLVIFTADKNNNNTSYEYNLA